MADSDLGGLGSWANSDLSQTVRMDAGVGADDGLPSEIRFVSNVAKLVRRRLAQPNIGQDPILPAVFLFQPSPPESGFAPHRVPMLDNGQTSVNGRIWFVGAGPGSGWYCDYNVNGDDELFKLVSETFKLSATPAIIFDPRLPVPEARFFPKGLCDPDSYQLVSISTEDVGFERVVAVIQSVYLSSLVTPDAQLSDGKIWHEHTKGWPSSRAEGIIQIYLKAGLAGAFPTCTIRHEQSMPEGRLDLEIEQSDPLDRGKITRHAILELKVLRSLNETGSPVTAKAMLDWVESGVRQAAAYRDSKSAKWSALLCFDMRKMESQQKCFDHVQQLAKDLSVFLRCWYLYATSKLYRDVVTSVT